VLELRHLHTDLIFAAKCIEKKKLEKVDNGLQSILNEIAIMRALYPHPLVVNLHEVYEGDNNIYIIMDIASGGNLYSEMRKRTTLYNRKEILLVIACLYRLIIKSLL
jgi:serine/threonine protein kinase